MENKLKSAILALRKAKNFVDQVRGNDLVTFQLGEHINNAMADINSLMPGTTYWKWREGELYVKKTTGSVVSASLSTETGGFGITNFVGRGEYDTAEYDQVDEFTWVTIINTIKTLSDAIQP